MDSATLTFTVLNERIDALPVHESLTMSPTRRQKWGFVLGFGAGFLGLIVGKLLPSSTVTVIFTSAMLVIEIVALAIALIPRRPWRFPGFAAERREYAEQLDFDLHHHDELVAWLRTFPKQRLQAMADYASQRYERLTDKYPLISGGLDKLGALPVVAALYLQFKDLSWPLRLSWLEILLGATLVGLYWGSLLLASVRFRAQLFVMLLTKALERVIEVESHEPQPTKFAENSERALA
jgi:hypothetical protein